MGRSFEADVAAIQSIDVVPTILETVCRTTGMGFAAIARVTEDRWVACAVRDEIAFGLLPGGDLKVETTICHEIRQGGAGVVIDHVAEDEAYRLHPTPALYGFQSYISVPITLPDGSFFGTLCAIDPRPAKLNTPETIGLFKMFAQLIAFHVDAKRRLDSMDEVRRSEAFVKSILAATPDGVSVLSTDGTLEFMNDRGLALHRLACGDVAGRKFASLWPEAERNRVEAAIACAAAGQTVFVEGYCPTALGEPCWWEADFVSFRPIEAGTAKVICVSRDVTDRVQATEAKRQNARALQDLNATLEHQVEQRTQERDRIWRVSQDMLGVADRDGTWISVNPAWTRILGWSPEEMVGRTFEWLEHPDESDVIRLAMARLARGEATGSFENRLRSAGGGYRLLSWTAAPMDGLLYCVARDITLEREREIALRDSIDFTRLALSAVGGVGVWTFDAVRDRFFTDAAIAELYGLDVERAAAGLSSADFLVHVYPEDRAALKATMAGGLVRPGDLELEYRVRHPDGSTRWVLSRGHTYFDANGAPVRRTGVGIDMTRQRLLEEQLRQSQKMEAVGQLTGGVAHDFNNLLTVIRSSVDFLSRQDLPEARRRRYIEAISSTVTRAAKLTGQLLAFARRQTLRPETFDVNASVVGITEMLGTLTGSRIHIETIVPDSPLFIRADPSQFDTALVNMAVNARDAMDGAGRLTIAVSAASAMPAVRAHDTVGGDFVVISVADTGSGIPLDQLDRIFEPFFTTKEVGHGTGLGLSQVFGFSKQSGGEITVESELGTGTTFSVYLPRVAGNHDSEPPPAPMLEPMIDGHGTCVLMVEDNEDVGTFAAHALEELGYVTHMAANADEALAELTRDAGRFDIVFSDVVMPGMSGIDFGHEIRARYPDLPVVLTSGYSHVLAQTGTHGFELLQKPYSIDQLSRILSRAAARTRRKPATVE